MFWDHIGLIFFTLAGSSICWFLTILFCMTLLEEILGMELAEQLGVFITMLFVVVIFSFLVYSTYIKLPIISTKWKKIHCKSLTFDLKKMKLEEVLPSFYKSLTFPNLECIYSLKFKSRVLVSKTFLYVPKNLKIEVRNENNKKIQTHKGKDNQSN